MSKKQHNIKLGYKHGLIDVNKIDPSPFQVRKYFDEDKQRELAESIKREGLIEPIVVRRKGRRYEIIAGERRFRAVRDFTEMKTIPAQIVKATDLEARRMSAAENLQREDLSAIEEVEAIVEIVDADLIEDAELSEDIEYQRSEGGDRKTEVRGQSQGIRVQRAEVGGRKP